IVAMTGLHIRGYAQGAAAIPLHKAAAALGWLLFYTGAAWSSGTLLVMPHVPAPLLAIGFAAVPSLAMTLLLGDRAAAFTAPTILATAGVAYLGAWPSGVWIAATLLAAGLLLICLPMLQREISARHDVLQASRTL
ncbi:MAG TPA: hypothetical protein VJS85_03175, partial [Rhizomicrobium sp.]|nr:hypothetical protein [Rhizomicrobium sp.]